MQLRFLCIRYEGDDNGIETHCRQKRCAGERPCGNAPTSPTTPINKVGSLE